MTPDLHKEPLLFTSHGDDWAIRATPAWSLVATGEAWSTHVGKELFTSLANGRKINLDNPFEWTVEAA